MTETLKRFGQILKVARQSSGIPRQEDAATKLGFTQSFLSQCEAGKIANPSKKFLKAIAQLYDVEYEGLVAVLVKEKYGVSFTNQPSAKLVEQLGRKQLAKFRAEIA